MSGCSITLKSLVHFSLSQDVSRIVKVHFLQGLQNYQNKNNLKNSPRHLKRNQLPCNDSRNCVSKMKMQAILVLNQIFNLINTVSGSGFNSSNMDQPTNLCRQVLTGQLGHVFKSDVTTPMPDCFAATYLRY